jgi:arylsulfatase
LKPADVNKFVMHLDVFPTFAELGGAKIPGGLQLDGRSLVPLLKDPTAPWAQRNAFTHIGRWPTGQAAESKYEGCRVRNSRFSMVRLRSGEKWELYDLKNDPGETRNVMAEFPNVAGQLGSAYDKWWDEVLPCLENEDAVPPKTCPYEDLYYKQFGRHS